MENEHLTYYERRLCDQIAKLEVQIKELEAEKRGLARQLAKARAERTGLQDITRKNSLGRVLAENSIIEELRTKGVPLSSHALYQAALVTNYELKETTFRTYLHRMKKRGLIKTAGHVGRWELSPEAA